MARKNTLTGSPADVQAALVDLVATRVLGWERTSDPRPAISERYPPREWWVAGDVDHPVEMWRPDIDMAAAWEVHLGIQEYFFSIRRKYYNAIQTIANERLGNTVMVGWPDVFGLIEPIDICRAALKAVEAKP